MALNALLEDACLDAVDVTRVILLDNASNNKKAMDLGANAYTVLWCCNHTLQLAVRGSFKIKIGQVRVMRVLELCKSVSKLVKSEARRDELKAACVATNTKFIMPSLPGKTRWNSTEENLESCVKVRTALLHLSLNDEGDNWSECVPNGREFIVAEAVQECLQPCKVATKLRESDKKASLH